jgi:hypothetical protein
MLQVRLLLLVVVMLPLFPKRKRKTKNGDVRIECMLSK